MKSVPVRLLIAAGFVVILVVGLMFATSVPNSRDTSQFTYNNPSLGAQMQTLLLDSTVPAPSPGNRIPDKFTKKANLALHASPSSKTPDDSQQAILTGQQIYKNLKSFPNGFSKSSKGNLAGTVLSASQTRTLSKQEKAIQDLKNQLGEKTVLKMDNLSHTLRYLDGDLQKLVQNSPEYRNALQKGDFGGMALALADQIPVVMNMANPAEEFYSKDISHDELGMTHVILHQQYEGAPVWGAEIGVHFNAENQPYQMSGVYAPTPENLSTSQLEISEQQAIDAAKKAIHQTKADLMPPKVQRMIYWDLGQKPVLCWNVELNPSYAESWEIFVSVTDGSIVHRYNRMVSANVQTSAPDLVGQVKTFNCWQEGSAYSAIDTTLPMYDAANSQPPNINKLKGVILGLDFRNQDPSGENLSAYLIGTDNVAQWDTTSVTLMSYYPIIDNYYRSVFNRNSIDNAGLNNTFIIHFRWSTGAQGQSHNENACWNPSANIMFFGDGDGLAGGKLAYGLDIVAHEYTHGVTGFEAGLIYETQSGALDEGLADFFGCMIDREDWLMAEDITPYGQYSDKIAMRDMSQPGNPKVMDQNPAVMAEYRQMPTTEDQGGVHINCGIPSYMLYLLAEGGSYAITKDKTEKIVYRARNEYLTQRSQFSDFRNALISAAKDLYGDNSAEMNACSQAAKDVGISENQSETPSTPGQVVDGDEMALFLVADPSVGQDPLREDFYYMLYLNSADQNFLVAQRYVASTRPAVSGDGQWALCVDAFNNIFMTNGAQEQQITYDSSVRTISMSKNQRYVSYTTVYYDSFIYVIDLEEEDVNQAVTEVPLRIPLNSEYSSMIDLTFADVMTFNFRGDYMFFDALQELQMSSGEKIYAWGMYSLRLADYKCDIVMQPQPDVEYGNPIFAHADDSLLLADLAVHDENDNITYSTVSIDFQQGKIGMLMKNTGVLSRPSFRGDDKHIVFLTIDSEGQKFLLVDGTLSDDRLSYIENSLQLIVSADVMLNHPNAFRAGEYVSQEGKIVAPTTVEFGDVDVGQIAGQSMTITNSGNADLEVLSITLSGDQAEWFRQDGLNQRIAPGASYQVNIYCQPEQAGSFSTTMQIQSTDSDNPYFIVKLQGAAVPSGQSTPTQTPISTPEPTNTPLPGEPSPTPTPTTTPAPTSTPAGEPALEILAQYEFAQIDLTSSGWKEIPGGFGNAAAGSVSANSFVGQRIPSSEDKVGIQISVQSGQVAFIHAVNPVDTGGSPVLIRMSLRADATGAAIALAGLKGNLSTGEAVDGGIATNIPATAADFMASEQQMTLVYEPDGSNWVTPIIQVAATASGTTNVFVDRLDVIQLLPEYAYSGDLFGSTIGLGSANLAPTGLFLPDNTYEFDQIDLASCGWTAIPGGFTGANAGNISANSFVGQLIPSSVDKVGIQFQVDKGEVAFAHAAAPIQSNNQPLLIRAALRANVAGAVVALAALKGNLSTGEGIDTSIATHIPATAAQMVNGEAILSLVCPPNTSSFVTPILQVLGSGDQAASVFVDRLEVYSLKPNSGYSGSLFQSFD